MVGGSECRRFRQRRTCRRDVLTAARHPRPVQVPGAPELGAREPGRLRDGSDEKQAGRGASVPPAFVPGGAAPRVHAAGRVRSSRGAAADAEREGGSARSSRTGEGRLRGRGVRGAGGGGGGG